MNRLPQNIEGARRRHLTVPRIKFCGDNRYDIIIREAGDVGSALAALLESCERDFAGACQTLSPTTWQLIYYTHELSFTRLLDPSFSPGAQITSQVTLNLLSDLPENFVRCENLLNAIGQLRLEMHEVSPDEAKAVWAAVSFVKLLSPDISDVASVEWWDPNYLRVLVNSSRSV